MFKSFKFKKWTAWVLTMFMVLSYVSPFKVLAAGEDVVNLQILATSDLHGKFMPYVYATDSENLNGSLAQLATVVKAQRAQNPNTILVDNGDTIQDNSNQIFLKDLDTKVHPMILAMNEMKYDTWTLGNHEFNYGVPTLEKIMAQFKGKALAGNVYKPDGTPLAAGYKIIEKGGVKVGIVGMTNPNITKWDAANLEGFKAESPITEARKVVNTIKGQVDVLVAVMHVGPTEEYQNDDGADVIAKAIPEFSAIVAGHAHSKIPENRSDDGTVITEPLNGGANLAKIDIKVTKGADGKYSVVDKKTDVKSSLINVDKTVPVDEALAEELKYYHETAIADARTVIGKLEGGDLVPAEEVKGIPTAQIQDTPMIDLINEVQMHYTGAKVSAAAAFSTTANIKAGDVTKAGVSNIYKYDNTLYKLEVTGAQLRKFMEWSASYYNTYKAGDLTLSFNENIRGYNYDMFDGVTYDVDITKAPGSRITNLKWLDGSLVRDDEKFILAVNNYRANSQLLADGGIFKGEAKPVLLEKDVKGDIGGVRELIGDYITNVKHGVIKPEVNNNWKVVGNNWDAKQREMAVKLINASKIKLPTSGDGRTPNVAPVTYDMALAANKIDVVSFNDFHGTLKEASSSSKDIGAAKLAGSINAVRAANPDTLVVAGGDLYQGSAMSNLKYGKPVSEVLKTIGIEASAIGNHEFDWGLDWISEWTKDGNFDFLASNIYSKTTGNPVTWAKPYKVVVKDGVKIGLIGLATPETAFKTKPENVKNIEFRDPVTAGNEWAKYLKETEKVDVVIALTHLGALQDKAKVITGEAADFAKAVKGVDAVISAHTHQSVAGVVNNIPVVQGYYNGRSLAKLSIYKDENGKIVKITPAVDDLYTRVKELPVDASVKAIVDKYNTELAPILNEVLGTTDKDLSHDKNAAGVSILGQWASDVMRAKAGTQIAIQNGGGLRTSIAKGDITMGKMYEVMPFDNTLFKMELKGSDIKKNIENGIANASIGWVQFSGMKVYYDINKAQGDRISAMYLMDGTKMDMDAYYTVVTNDFMATGGDGYNFSAGRNQLDTGVPIREALVEALRNLKAEGKVLSVTPIDYLIASAPPADNGAIANETEKVVEAVKAASNQSTIVVDITGNSIAAKEIFEAIKGQDKNVTFVKDGISWTFNGLDIKPELIKDIDLSLKTVSEELKNKEIAKMKAVVGKDVTIVPFSFNYDGPLPGEATVKVFIGKEWANKAVYVNRYYSDKNTYEIISEVTVDSEGYITFKTNHCSDYFVMEKAVSPDLPQTGSQIDMGVMVNLGSIIVMLGVALIFIDRRKRKNNAA
ncbi:5'-nucleotidase C-terminal domain-containing protein [Clostridium swellfunianum]|uniref:5'-nucleotidase C-terminal domain-containing protein n=1 Tax=Clostridium swellfunianum TaxID=1367462 RepID=UPI00202E0BFF|nr:5'-nucleotidase C-terminal domain-containing protein [Clostridium swellfunianum]MCM0648251.1 5'-nucleotidase C-terminal domain-containing protein [Clostridium swellfunianum]